MMQHRLAVPLSLLGILAGICSAGAWLAARPPVERFIPLGARDIRVQEVGLGQRLLTYEATGGRYEWYFAVAAHLEDSGWIPPDKWGPPDQSNTYTHVSPLWIGYLWEQAELYGEPNHARIILRRWITIPWKTYANYVKSLR